MPTVSSTDPILESQILWDRYKKIVITVLVLALLAVAAWGGYRVYSDRREASAENLLATAKTGPDFQKVISQYQGTAASKSAYLFLAEEQRKDQKFEEANKTLQSFIDKYPNHQLKGTARMAMAANLESLGKTDEALNTYQRLAADDPQGFNAPLALMAEVTILKEKKQLEEAQRVCETILTKYRESLIAGEANRQLRMLKPATPPEPPASQAPAPTATVPTLLQRPKESASITPTTPAASAGASATPAATAAGSPAKKKARQKRR